MTIATPAHGGFHSKIPISFTTAAQSSRSNQTRITSAALNHIRKPSPGENLNHLIELHDFCNLSGHRFPTLDAAGSFVPADDLKLRTDISHSSVVISVFTKPEFQLTQFSFNSTEVTNFVGIGRDWIRRVAPLTPENGRLIGFGRAVADLGLTASIYDVMNAY